MKEHGMLYPYSSTPPNGGSYDYRGPEWENGARTCWRLGPKLAALKMYLELTGHLRVEGNYNLAVTMIAQEGGIIFAPNHPDGLSPFMLSAIFWRYYLFHSPRYFLWNVPRENLVTDERMEELRCLVIRRGDAADARKKRVEQMRRIEQLLNLGARIIMFGEGTRTFGEDKQQRWIWNRDRSLCMLSIVEARTTIPLIASRTNAKVFPVAIKIPGLKDPLDHKETVRFLLAGHCMTINFGDPYEVEKSLTHTNRDMWLEQQNRRLQDAILNAGRS